MEAPQKQIQLKLTMGTDKNVTNLARVQLRAASGAEDVIHLLFRSTILKTKSISRIKLDKI